MHHKYFGNFLYEWCRDFSELILITSSDYLEFHVDIYYLSTNIQRFSYSNSYQNYYTEDINFLLTNFPELDIKL